MTLDCWRHHPLNINKTTHKWVFKYVFNSISDVETLFDRQRIGVIINQRKQRWKEFFATLEDGLVKNAHTNKKNLFSQILLGDKKLPITELDNNPPHFKTTLSDFLILDSSVYNGWLKRGSNNCTFLIFFFFYNTINILLWTYCAHLSVLLWLS